MGAMSPTAYFRGSEPLARLTRLHMVSTAADACIAVSLAGTLFFNLPTDAARSQVTLYLLLTLAPFAIVTPFLAPAVERVARAPMRAIAGASWARAGLALAIAANPLGLLLHPASFLVLVFGRGYAITKRALVPSLVTDPAELMAANAKLSRAGTTAAAAGGLTGTVLMYLTGPGLVLQLAAVLHVAAALLSRRVPVPPPTTKAVDADAISERPARSLLAPRLAMGSLRLTTGLLAFTAAFTLQGANASGFAFGVVAITVPLGSFSGTFVSPRVRRAYTDERTVLGACLAASALVVAGGAAGGIVGVVFALPVVALASSVGRHAYDSIVQRESEPQERNRAFARGEAVLQIAWVTGALGPTTMMLSPQTTQLVAAAVLAVLAIPISVRVSARPSVRTRSAPAPARVAV